MSEIKKILIRLPNWLGDMVMATAFVNAVQQQYPQAQIDCIAKKGIDFLLDYFPTNGQRYIFSKEDYKGTLGVIRFARQITKQQQYDLLFCLPDSLSAAIMAYFIGAKKSIGFKKSLHSIFFNHTYLKKKQVHRVLEYVHLLEQFTQTSFDAVKVSLKADVATSNNTLIININSEASSRRLPVSKAVSIINYISKNISNPIVLIGSPKEKPFVDTVFQQLHNTTNVKNVAGATSLPELIQLFAQSKAVLSTDSGPAHISNALGKNTVVLFGAGNEQNTAPFNNEHTFVIRLNQLLCEPCTKNICKFYTEPKCLTMLNEVTIGTAVQNALI
ncbi:glycosyltransferase family 9 protein [Ferruginibacter yonginensis]|uniref:Glycosyltransferase family 9 protein n=1 Tax=Ferruginibacter yonginensis TaxID=1310416 RepID=A0ABV8QXD3_9BACT